MTLFRNAALSAQQIEWLGNIVVIRPLSLTLLSTFAVGVAGLVVVFLACAGYTARTSVSGRLMPVNGLVQVYAPQAGIVVDKHVREGQAVHQGDPLFVLSGERESLTRGALSAGASTQINLRRQSLEAELDKMKQLQQQEAQDLRDRIASLETERAKLDNQLAGQGLRVRLAEESLERARQLQQQRYISREQLQQNEAAVLEQKLVLQQLERERVGIDRELQTQHRQRETLTLRHASQQAQLTRMLSSTEQELSENETRRRLVITAPASGTVTALAVERGQTADLTRPLLAIIPAGDSLQAELYASSRAIGFIRPGQAVQLRYQAFPYEKFGHAHGTVSTVTRSTLVADGGSGEARYRITVRLARQDVRAYGQVYPLQAGMAVDADILREHRRLAEWVLDPLYSLSGRM